MPFRTFPPCTENLPHLCPRSALNFIKVARPRPFFTITISTPVGSRRDNVHGSEVFACNTEFSQEHDKQPMTAEAYLRNKG